MHLADAHSGCGFALAQRGGRDAAHHHVLAVWSVSKLLEHRKPHLHTAIVPRSARCAQGEFCSSAADQKLTLHFTPARAGHLVHIKNMTSRQASGLTGSHAVNAALLTLLCIYNVK